MTEGTPLDLTDAAAFEPLGASSDIIAQVLEVTAEIDSRRPLSPSVLERLQTDILYDRVHSSAVTEGNRLSRRETIIVLSTGVVEAGTRRDRLEVRNLAKAILETEEALHNGVRLDPRFLRHLHGILLADIDDRAAGQFRSENVAISGAKVQPPAFPDVPDLLKAVLDADSVNGEHLNPLQRAAWLHWAVSRIHPFRDGNGRLARLLQDYVLLQANLVPAPLKSEDREGAYYAALEAADLGDGRPLLELVAKNTLWMADRYLAIIRQQEADHDWIDQITEAATENVSQSEHRRFLAVQRASNLLKNEFFNLADALTQRIPGLRVSLRDYGSLDFDKFQEIEGHGRAQRTWFFGLEFRIGDTVLRYIFWFGCHHASANDVSDALPSKVVMLVSAEEEQNYYRLLDELEEDRVTLREIVPDGNRFWRRRFDPVQERHEWDTDVEPGKVARDFIEEVLRKLGLL